MVVAGYFYLLILIILVVGVILIGVLVYKRIVSRSMNRALETGEHQGYIDVWQFITIIGAIAIITLSILAYSSTKSLSEEVSNLENNVNNQTTEINYLRSVISNLQDDLNGYFDSTNPVQGFTAKLVALDTNSVTYHIDFSLLSIETGASVSLVLRDSTSTDHIYSLTSQSLSYGTDVVLDLTETYTAYAYVSGSIITQYQLGKIYVSEDVENRYNLDFYIEKNSDEAFSTLTLDVYTSLVTPDTLKTASIRFQLYINGDLLSDSTMTTPSTSWSGYESFSFSYQAEIDEADFENISMIITITDNGGMVTTKEINPFY